MGGTSDSLSPLSGGFCAAALRLFWYDPRGSKMLTKKREYRKGSIDHHETFDEFLAKKGLLAETEDTAVKEIFTDQINHAAHKQLIKRRKKARKAC
jgi:hypothetical protein